MVGKNVPGPLVLFAVLSACGSSGGDGAADVGFELVDTLQSRATAASEAQPEDLSGTATMSGYIGLNIAGEAGPVYGNMDMEANFSTGDVEATASNLGIYQDIGSCISGCELILIQSLAGELTLDDDEGIFNVNQFDGTLSGNLTSSTRNYEMSIDTNGDFLINGEGLLASAALGGSGDEVLITPLDGVGPPQSVNATGLFIVAD